MVEKNHLRSIFKLVTVVTTVLLIIFIYRAIQLGFLQDKMVLVRYMKRLGWIAPVFFIFLQMIQVIFPVIPGGASCLAGVLAFGAVPGFIYNYIGLVLGSFAAFLLSRRYGLNLVQKLFEQETIDKYLEYIKNRKFNKIFFLGIFLPGLPDDLLCYVAGLSSISYKSFLFIILTGKPLALLMYSFFIELF